MKFYQVTYFLTIIFAVGVASLLHYFYKIDTFQALSFSVNLYILYHLLEWKYNQGEE